MWIVFNIQVGTYLYVTFPLLSFCLIYHWWWLRSHQCPWKGKLRSVKYHTRKANRFFCWEQRFATLWYSILYSMHTLWLSSFAFLDWRQTIAFFPGRSQRQYERAIITHSSQYCLWSNRFCRCLEFFRYLQNVFDQGPPTQVNMYTMNTMDDEGSSIVPSTLLCYPL